jgi:hypothetical protein
MRLLLFLLGVFVAVICAEKPAAAQNGGWCAYYILTARVRNINNVWPP